mgnify:CR=1 FL=1
MPPPPTCSVACSCMYSVGETVSVTRARGRCSGADVAAAPSPWPARQPSSQKLCPHRGNPAPPLQCRATVRPPSAGSPRPAGFECGISYPSPTAVPEGDLARGMRACCMTSKPTAVAEVFFSCRDYKFGLLCSNVQLCTHLCARA